MNGREPERPDPSGTAPGTDADRGWAAYITHVTQCPDCRNGVDCRTAERLHTAWKAAQCAARGTGEHSRSGP